MKSVLNSISFVLVSVLIYLTNIDPIMIDGVWSPIWAPYLDRVKMIIAILFVISSSASLFIRYKERKGNAT